MEREKILKKVREIETNVKFLTRCIRVGICPQCGSDQLFEINAENNSYLPINEYKCERCYSTFTD